KIAATKKIHVPGWSVRVSVTGSHPPISTNGVIPPENSLQSPVGLTIPGLSPPKPAIPANWLVTANVTSLPCVTVRWNQSASRVFEHVAVSRFELDPTCVSPQAICVNTGVVRLHPPLRFPESAQFGSALAIAPGGIVSGQSDGWHADAVVGPAL